MLCRRSRPGLGIQSLYELVYIFSPVPPGSFPRVTRIRLYSSVPDARGTSLLRQIVTAWTEDLFCFGHFSWNARHVAKNAARASRSSMASAPRSADQMDRAQCEGGMAPRRISRVRPASGRPGDPKPTPGSNGLCNGQPFHAQKSGRDEVTGANVLSALFSEA